MFPRSLTVVLLAFFLFALLANAAPAPVNGKIQGFINELIPNCNECVRLLKYILLGAGLGLHLY